MRIQKQHLEKASGSFVFAFGLAAFLFQLKSYLKYFPPLPGHEIIRLIPEEFNKIIPESATLQVVADGFQWAEGPIWVQEPEGTGYLLFSDTKLNSIFKWEEGGGLLPLGVSLFRKQSGCRHNASRCAELREPGSNGLAAPPGWTLTDGSGMGLLLCEHGERAVSRISETGLTQSLVTHFEGIPLNSPNDLALGRVNGSIYFTDPPYGLNGLEEDDEWLQRRSGIYHVNLALPGSPVTLLSSRLKRPNGIALSPAFDKLYVSNSGAESPGLYVFDLGEDGLLAEGQGEEGRVFYDAQQLTSGGTRSSAGSPDGLKVDSLGNVLATGPGGILVFSESGAHLGNIMTGRQCSNLAIGGDGYLYVTAGDSLLRIATAGVEMGGQWSVDPHKMKPSSPSSASVRGKHSSIS